jgi:hypothetical protein
MPFRFDGLGQPRTAGLADTASVDPDVFDARRDRDLSAKFDLAKNRLLLPFVCGAQVWKLLDNTSSLGRPMCETRWRKLDFPSV